MFCSKYDLFVESRITLYGTRNKAYRIDIILYCILMKLALLSG